MNGNIKKMSKKKQNTKQNKTTIQWAREFDCWKRGARPQRERGLWLERPIAIISLGGIGRSMDDDGELGLKPIRTAQQNPAE